MATKQFIGNVKGQKGDKGVSITSVKQTTTSDIDGGINEITVTLSDGRKETFQVANGNTGKKGDQGVSVKTVAQTTTSNADGGSNVITVTLSDGTQAKFTVKNGNKGDKGDKGDTGDLSEECADARTSATGKSYDDLKARLDVEYNFLDTKANCIEGETSGDNITDSANAPLAYMKNSGYTKQDGTSTPNAPIHVDGLADKGYFDGELVQGYLNATTGVLTGTNGVTSKNGIPCKANDVVKVIYDGKVGVDFYKLRIVFYDNSNALLSTIDTDASNVLEATAPANTSYMKFHTSAYESMGIIPTPSTAKHIAVTINGQYVLRVKTCGKNLFDDSIIGQNRFVCKCKAGNTYVFSANVLTNTLSDTRTFLRITDTYQGKAKSTLASIIQETNSRYNATSSKFTFKMQAQNDGYLYVAVASGSGFNYLEKMQVELGTVATPFVEHQSSEALIPISAPLYDGDYIEVYADGSGKIVRKAIKRVLDSSLGWLRNGSTVIRFYFPAYGDTTYQEKSNIATSSSWNDMQSGAVKNAVARYEQYIGFNFTDCQDMTLEEFKTWIDEQNAYVIFGSTTPTTEPLTAEQVAEFMKLRTYKTTTHINADGEKVVRYVVDTKTYIDNKFAELQALMNV